MIYIYLNIKFKSLWNCLKQEDYSLVIEWFDFWALISPFSKSLFFSLLKKIEDVKGEYYDDNPFKNSLSQALLIRKILMNSSSLSSDNHFAYMIFGVKKIKQLPQII